MRPAADIGRAVAVADKEQAVGIVPVGKAAVDVEPAVEPVAEPDMPALADIVAAAVAMMAMMVAAAAAGTPDSYSNTIVDTGLHKTSGFRISDINPYFQPSPM